MPNFFREWREAAGLSQAAVERIHGWPASRVSNLENDRAVVTDPVLQALARSYACTPEELVAGPPPEDRIAPAIRERLAARVAQPAALTDALKSLQRLSAELRAIKSDLLPRLEEAEQQIEAASASIAKAISRANSLSALFERGLDSLREAAGQQPRRRRPRSPALAAAAADKPDIED